MNLLRISINKAVIERIMPGQTWDITPAKMSIPVHDTVRESIRYTIYDLFEPMDNVTNPH